MRPGDSATIYKLVPTAAWRQAELLGRFIGSPVDVADGYIHFSTAAQVRVLLHIRTNANEP